MPERSKRLLITVGTTKFDQLIETILQEDVIKVFLEEGFGEWTLQHGNFQTDLLRRIKDTINVKIESFDYTPDMTEYIEAADLVIGHAGAGTILDVLRGPAIGADKTDRPALLIITNDQLMNGHQSEIAQAMSANDYCTSCSIRYIYKSI